LATKKRLLNLEHGIDSFVYVLVHQLHRIGMPVFQGNVSIEINYIPHALIMDDVLHG